MRNYLVWAASRDEAQGVKRVRAMSPKKQS
jgi:hypothetical protein